MSGTADRDDGGAAPRRRPAWWLLVPSAALVGAAAFVLATAWGPVLSGHPAYPVTLVTAGAVGLLGLGLSLRRG